MSQRSQSLRNRLNELSPIEWCHTVLSGKNGGAPHFTDTPAVMHHEWSSIWESKTRHAAIAAPRGHGKSTHFCIGFILYSICKREAHFIVIISDSIDQAKSHILCIEDELENNELIKEAYGDLAGAKRQKWTETEFVTTTGIKLMAFGSGKKLRGTKYGAHRPDIIVCDDMENDTNVESATQRNKLWQWFWSAVSPALRVRGGRLIVVGTVMHTDSLLIRLLNERRWITKRYKALVNGASAWETGMPTDQLLAIRDEYKARGELPIFYQEYNNDPVSDETREFKSEWYKTCRFMESATGDKYVVTGFGQKPISSMRTYVIVDPTVVKDSQDRTGVVALHIDEHHNVYIQEAKEYNVDIWELIELLHELYAQYKPSILAVEQDGGGKAIQAFIDKDLQETKRYINITPVSSDQREKASRIRSLIPFYRSGWIHHNEVDCEALEVQQNAFPRTKRDDVMDALAYLPDLMSPGTNTIDKITYEEYEILQLQKGKRPMPWGSRSFKNRYGRSVIKPRIT